MIWTVIGLAVGIWLFVKYVSPAIDRAMNVNGSKPTEASSRFAASPVAIAPPSVPIPSAQAPVSQEVFPSARDPHVPPRGWYDDPLSVERLRYSDGVQWTDQTARKLPDTVDGAAVGDAESDGPLDAPSATVVVEGCRESVGPTCSLVVSVEPGYVVVDTCREDCADASHALVLTAEEAAEACQRARIAAGQGSVGGSTTGPQNFDLAVDWDTDEEDGTSSVSFDWTAKFLDREAQAAWEAGNRPVDADCGTLYLSGEMDTPGSELNVFVTLLSECARLAGEWDAGRVTQESVSDAMARLGRLVEE